MRSSLLRRRWFARLPPLGVFGGEMAFRAVLFDVGDTLWHAPAALPAAEFRRLAALRAKQSLARMGVQFENAGSASRAAWSALESANRHARATGYAEPDYGEVARMALHAIGLQLTREQAAEFLEAIYVSGVEGGKQAYPDAREALETLAARGFKLAVVTNRAFGGTRFRDDLAAMALSIEWDAVVVSVEVGFLKPHPAIFEEALRQLGVTANQALMVGNSLAEDVAGAQRIGIAGAWRRSLPDAESVIPDFEFTELSDLIALPALAKAG